MLGLASDQFTRQDCVNEQQAEEIMSMNFQVEHTIDVLSRNNQMAQVLIARPDASPFRTQLSRLRQRRGVFHPCTERLRMRASPANSSPSRSDVDSHARSRRCAHPRV